MNRASGDFAPLREFIAAPHRELRTRVLELLQEQDLQIPLEVSRAEYRDRVLKALRRLAEKGLGAMAYPEEAGGEGSPARSIAVFETLAFGDTSILVKFGVQFGLWGGSVHQLGTERHRSLLRDIGSLELPGCYAMTEIDHGSNVRELETTATWDPDGREFVIHTPHEGAGKEWIGNAALHGRMATVFARLVVDGTDHGVHALLVPLRDDQGGALPGVRIQDNGPKAGLNGVDNGRIWFDQVRVPRENLLDRFAGVSDEGRYASPIESPNRRFFTMLGTLVAGRISIAAASVSAAKVGLAVAVRYSLKRRQFGPDGAPEVPLLDHPSHQRLLLPAVADTYALHFATRELVARYDRMLQARRQRHPLPDDATRELEAAAAGLKAVASWHCAGSLQAAREAMGGRGFHGENRIGRLRSDTDIFATFEGANTVLLQLVARSLLSQFREDMGDLTFMGMLRYLADRAGTRVSELNPVVTRRTDRDHLLDPDFHAAAYRYREERLLTSAARRLKARLDDGIEPFAAFTQCQDHLVELGRAHAQRITLEAFQEAVARAPAPGASEFLRELAALHALAGMEARMAWFLEAGYVDPPKSRAIRRQVTALCGEVRETALEAVNAWGIPDPVLGAPDAL